MIGTRAPCGAPPGVASWRLAGARPFPARPCRAPKAQATQCASVLQLVQKKCVPCEDDSGSLDQMGLCLASDRPSAEAMCRQLSGWQIVEDEHGRLRLRAQLRMKSFLKALALCDRIAEVAEAEGHHPDIHITGWNRVALELWTHARNGLTENDFIMAAKIDAIPKADLLGGKRPKFADI